jgi:hypothetical protein
MLSCFISAPPLVPVLLSLPWLPFDFCCSRTLVWFFFFRARLLGFPALA